MAFTLIHGQIFVKTITSSAMDESRIEDGQDDHARCVYGGLREGGDPACVGGT